MKPEQIQRVNHPSGPLKWDKKIRMYCASFFKRHGNCVEAALRPIWRGRGFRPRRLWGTAGIRAGRRFVLRGELLLRIRYYGERRKLDHFREGHLTISEKGRPHNGDISNWAAILPKKPPPVLNLKHAEQPSFGNTVWRDPEEGPHIARPNLELAVSREDTMDPRTDGAQRQRKLVGLHKELGTTKDGPSAHTKIACLVCRALNDALRVKTCFARGVPGNLGTRQDNSPVISKLSRICLLENLPSRAVRLDNGNKGNSFSLKRSFALGKSFRNRTFDGIGPAALPPGIESAT